MAQVQIGLRMDPALIARIDEQVSAGKTRSRAAFIAEAVEAALTGQVAVVRTSPEPPTRQAVEAAPRSSAPGTGRTGTAKLPPAGGSSAPPRAPRPGDAMTRQQRLNDAKYGTKR